jgi:peptidoglycan hydrolase CwlO-like protein
MPKIKLAQLPLRALATLVTLVALLGTGLTSSSSGDLQGQISAAQSASSSLRSEIAADSHQIANTADGLGQARDRLAAIQGELDRRVSELGRVQGSLLAARDHLVDLENRLHLATGALATNLRASYEGSQPDLMTIVLQSRGFNDLLEQVSFMAKVARQDARVLGVTRTARRAVAQEAARLETLETRDRALADQVLAQRNSLAALRSALLAQQLHEMALRSRASARYHALSQRLSGLEKKAAAEAARANATGNADVGGVALDTHGMVQPPRGAPEAIKQIIAAGNAIATLPYIYGGGHASFHANGYDCSGSVSYVLAAAGLVSSPMVSGDFEGWGDPGPGRWVTIYANAAHVWMTVAGWRFDTVALAEGGTRWAQGGGEFSGFVVRHPPGL